MARTSIFAKSMKASDVDALHENIKNVDSNIIGYGQEHPSLWKLLYDDTMPSGEVCKDAKQDIEKLWPKVAELISEDQLMVIAQGLRHANITLATCNSRFFLTIAADALTKSNRSLPLTDEDAAEIVQHTIMLVDAACGRAGPSLPPLLMSLRAISSEQRAEQLITVKEMFQTEANFFKCLAEAPECNLTMVELEEKWANATDQDTRKELFLQSCRLRSTDLAQAFNKTFTNNKEIAASRRKVEMAMKDSDAKREEFLKTFKAAWKAKSGK